MPVDTHTDDDTLYQQAEAAKVQGNAAFAAGECAAAISHYSQGIVWLDRIILSSDASSVSKNNDALKCALWSNRAAARLKMEVDLPLVVADCQAALALCTSKDGAALRSKILYRSAKARFLLANNTPSTSTTTNSSSSSQLLQEAAKDILLLLQTDPTNAEANQLMKLIRIQHKQDTASTLSPLAKILQMLLQNNNNSDSTATTPEDCKRKEDECHHNLKLLLGLLHNDTPNCAMELGRFHSGGSNDNSATKNGISVLWSIATTTFAVVVPQQNSTTTKTAVLALQCLSTAASHPPFVRTFFAAHQGPIMDQLVQAATATTTTTTLDPNSQQVYLYHGDDWIVSVLALLDRIVLHADRDDPNLEITGQTALEYTAIIASLGAALEIASVRRRDDDTDGSAAVVVVRAVLDVLSVWTTAGAERDSRIRLSAPKDLPPPVSPQEVRAFTPQQLAAYKQRQFQCKTRDEAWAYDRSLKFIASPSFGTLLTLAVKHCPNHVVRREITVAISRLLACIMDDDKIKETVRPFLQDIGPLPKQHRQGPIIEEVYNDDGKVEHDVGDEDETEPDVSIETKMERALITTALLLSKKECGAWALTTGWSESGSELPDLIEKSQNNSAAQCLASEVLQAAAAMESTRGMVTAIVSSGCMETLMRSSDRDVRSGAAAAVAKLGLSDKRNQSDAGELMGLLQAACEMMDDDQDGVDTASVSKVKTAKNEKGKEFNQFSSVATSSLERAIEMMTYLASHTVIKDELAAGFGGPNSARSAMDSLVRAADLPGAGESLSGFGLATIFQLMAVTNEQVRKEAFEGKEVTMDQYDEMQRMGKTEEEKEVMDQEQDTDSKDSCMDRIRKMASANVPRALVALTEGASEHTLEQLTLAMNRMAEDQSIRGVMIQQGVLSTCIKVEKAEGPTETDVMKKVIRTARHCLAKMLVSTNPSLLTSAQKLGSIRPLLQLVRDIKGSDLQHFEALLALTNLASSGEDAKNRIVSERGIPCLHFAMFADHEMVRRAATETMCNLVPHEAMMAHLSEPDNLRLLMAFAVDFEDHYECARAAAGCIAMASQDETVALAISQVAKFKEQVPALLESGRLEIMQRALVLVLNLVGLGPTTKTIVVEAGLVEFCRAYIDLQKHAAGESDGGLAFSEEERQLLPVTIDIAKKILELSDDK